MSRNVCSTPGSGWRPWRSLLIIGAAFAFAPLFGASPAQATRDDETGLSRKENPRRSESLAIGSARDLARIDEDLERDASKGDRAFGKSRSVKDRTSSRKQDRTPDPFTPMGPITPGVRVPLTSGAASPIPEPASTALIALGALIVGKALRRRR